MPLLAENIPEDDREAVGLIGNADFLGARDEGRLAVARLRQSGEIAFDVGEKDRGAGVGEPLGEKLQRDSLAAAGRPSDQAMTIAQSQRKVPVIARFPLLYAGADEYLAGNRSWSVAHW